MLSSTSTGAPFAADAGSQRVPSNLSAVGEAKRVARSPRPAARKFTTNAFVSRMACKLPDLLSRQNKRSGGSSDTAHTALLVSPRNEPPAANAVTIVPRVGNDPTTARKSCPSMAKLLRGCGRRAHGRHADGHEALHPGYAVGGSLARPRALARRDVATMRCALRVGRA